MCRARQSEAQFRGLFQAPGAQGTVAVVFHFCGFSLRRGLVVILLALFFLLSLPLTLPGMGSAPTSAVAWLWQTAPVKG